MSIISYPIPPYSNVPIEPQYYQPRSFVISDISLGATTTVTTSTNQNYVVGQLVRLIIPPGYGCTQLNNVPGYVISITSDTEVVLDINSSQNVDPFIAASNKQNPQILPVGDVNTGAQNNQGRSSTFTYVPGSFINISPGATNA